MKKILFKNYSLAFPSIVIVSLLSACGTPSQKQNAPVLEKNISASTVAEKKDETKIGVLAEKPLDTTLFYVVKPRDTLIRIALDHGKSYSDLVSWNALINPNDIKVDQVLRIAPPDSIGGVGGVVGPSVRVDVKSLPPMPLNPSTNKTGPRGDKRAYSDTVLAELQKSDLGLVAPALPVAVTKPIVTVAPAVSTAISVKVQEQVASNANDSDSVDWVWPTTGKVTANFDDSKSKGIDISGQAGQDVVAAGAGKVMYEGSAIRGWGNLVIIRHNDMLVSAYAHNKSNLVKEGQIIKKGQKIAEMGSTDTDAVKLHFEIRQNGKPVDPSKFLPSR